MTEMRLKISSAKLAQFCLALNVLNVIYKSLAQQRNNFRSVFATAIVVL